MGLSRQKRKREKLLRHRRQRAQIVVPNRERKLKRIKPLIPKELEIEEVKNNLERYVDRGEGVS